MRPRIQVNKGDRYGRLTIVSEAPKRKGKRYFVCKCDCGAVGVFPLIYMRTGHTKSCGCYRSELTTSTYTKHGLSGTHLYKCWCSMKGRCLRPKSPVYSHYGGRGISVCKEWMEFQPFMDWSLSNGYKDGLSIDRIDVNGNYEPSNCRWIPKSDQPKNRRTNVMISLNGDDKTLADWARQIGITRSGLERRLKSWPLEKALSEPVNQSHVHKYSKGGVTCA